MGNVVQLPLTHRRHVGAAFLTEPPPHGHAVQFYEDDEFLNETVAHFLAAGLQAGDGLIVIATASHYQGIARHLEPFGLERGIEEGRVKVLDASETLSKLMIGDMPDADLFRDLVARHIASVRGSQTAASRVRAFGEMVDLLWRDGNSRAAIRLEELWNDAGKAHSFSLLCAYVMGNFYKEGDETKFFEVCGSHSHVIPTEAFAQIDDPHARLREISFLQQRARALENEIRHRRALESALRDALRERARAEEELRASVRREKAAREQAEASDAFKEVFLGILGHDLRNPLNTILTTVRLMKLRRELSQESEKRLDRVETSGVRMQRMIEQLLDVTRARLSDGIPLQRTEQDLVPLVSKIVEEIRVAHPVLAIELEASGRCGASVDGDRFEQVVSNLLGNAVAHGDPSRPIRVRVTCCNGVASVSVHNYGAPIAPAFLRMIFDPFKRVGTAGGRSAGLGLGLYISASIVSAHGGKIEVESSEETGTLFEVIVPTHG